MNSIKRRKLLFYGRILLAVTLFVLFAIFGTSAVLTHSVGEHPWLLSALLILSVVLLPRSARRPAEDEELSDEEMLRIRSVHKWLTWVRLAFFLVAAFIFLALPELV